MKDKSQKQLVSFVILAYNQEKFIREAVEGAFSQTYYPMEIIISDDCSTDRTFEIIEEMTKSYNGPHSIILNRNKKNLGLGMHFNLVVEISQGEVIVIAAGDDISLPNRTKSTMEILRRNSKLMAISLSIERFNDGWEKNNTNGALNGGELKIYDIKNYIENIHFHINAPARAIRKEVFEFFGPLSKDCSVEDGPVLFRCLLLGQVSQLSEIGVLYRIHDNNMYASKNKYLIDYEPIYNNYFKDIEVAIEKKIINQKFADNLKISTKQRLNKALINAGFGRSKNKVIYFIRNIFFSDLYSGRAKLKHFKSCF